MMELQYAGTRETSGIVCCSQQQNKNVQDSELQSTAMSFNAQTEIKLSYCRMKLQKHDFTQSQNNLEKDLDSIGLMEHYGQSHENYIVQKKLRGG